MAYNDVISRADAQALVPEEVANLISIGVTEQSAALQRFRHVPISRNQQRIPVIASLPTAYFVNGDTGLKQTTDISWTNKYLNVEEIAAIIPIPEAVLDDTSYDIWGAVKPLAVEAIARVLDAAVFFGTNKPTSWPTDIVTAATAAGNSYVRGTNAAAAGGVQADISGLFRLVELDGFDVNGMIAERNYKGLLRNARDTTGQLIADPTYGAGVTYPMRGLWPTAVSTAELIAGDFTEGIVGVRQDITYKLLTEAVITDGAGLVIYNLAQQDMVALRVVARYAWQVANVLNRDQVVEANRYPFAVMLAPATGV
jgi:HK97 family phage major capsid protein